LARESAKVAGETQVLSVADSGFMAVGNFWLLSASIVMRYGEGREIGSVASKAFLVAAAVLVAIGIRAGTLQAGGRAEPAAEQIGNLWVDGDGGVCRRSARAAIYRTGSACSSIDAAWDRCLPGDTIVIKAGAYGPQEVSGDKPRPGCTIRGEPNTTIADLTTGGSFLTLENVTVEAGEARGAGWKARASNVTLRGVRLHGPFVRVDIYRVSNVRWVGGELGSAGQTGGKRVCGVDQEPVQIGEADHITFDGITFHPQDYDPTPSICAPTGYHLEMIRVDGGTSFFTLRNSTFENGDHSGTSTIFITTPFADTAPHDLVFENNFFGTNESLGAFNVHSIVSACVNYTFAYNTFLQSPGLFQCTSAVNVMVIANLGSMGPSSPMACFGTSTNNVWQGPRANTCAGDRWVAGDRTRTDRLGLGGPDGFRLQPGSPAIDAGEASGYCIASLGARDREQQRRHFGRRCDAGADEYNAGPAVIGSLVRTRWTRATAERKLTLTLRIGEPVSVVARLTQGRRGLGRVMYDASRVGRHRLTLPVSSRAVPGVARLKIVMIDVARNKLVIERELRVSAG
jgi:hypothetical protein